MRSHQPLVLNFYFLPQFIHFFEFIECFVFYVNLAVYRNCTLAQLKDLTNTINVFFSAPGIVLIVRNSEKRHPLVTRKSQGGPRGEGVCPTSGSSDHNSTTRNR